MPRQKIEDIRLLTTFHAAQCSGGASFSARAHRRLGMHTVPVRTASSAPHAECGALLAVPEDQDFDQIDAGSTGMPGFMVELIVALVM